MPELCVTFALHVTESVSTELTIHRFGSNGCVLSNDEIELRRFYRSLRFDELCTKDCGNRVK